MYYVLERISALARPKCDDTTSDRWNYSFTGKILILLIIVICTKQYFGSPIQCWIPPEIEHEETWQLYIERYCFVENTYFVNETNLLFPSPPERQKAEIRYYQWIPLFLSIQLVLFLIVRSYWSAASESTGLDAKSILIDIPIPNLQPKKFRKSMAHYARIIRDIIKDESRAAGRFLFILPHTSYFTFSFFGYKLLSCINVFGQLYLMNFYLNTKYKFWGWEVLRDLYYERDWKESGHFPHVTFCDFYRRDETSSEPMVFPFQCVLMINTFNEKMYIILWFWYAVLCLVNIYSAIYWFFTSLLKWYRRRWIKLMLKFERIKYDNKKIDKLMASIIHNDGFLSLRLIEENAGFYVASAMVAELYKDLSKSGGDKKGGGGGNGGEGNDGNGISDSEVEEEDKKQPDSLLFNTVCVPSTVATCVSLDSTLTSDSGYGNDSSDETNVELALHTKVSSFGDDDETHDRFIKDYSQYRKTLDPFDLRNDSEFDKKCCQWIKSWKPSPFSSKKEFPDLDYLDTMLKNNKSTYMENIEKMMEDMDRTEGNTLPSMRNLGAPKANDRNAQCVNDSLVSSSATAPGPSSGLAGSSAGLAGSSGEPGKSSTAQFTPFPTNLFPPSTSDSQQLPYYHDSYSNSSAPNLMDIKIPIDNDNTVAEKALDKALDNLINDNGNEFSSKAIESILDSCEAAAATSSQPPPIPARTSTAETDDLPPLLKEYNSIMSNPAPGVAADASKPLTIINPTFKPVLSNSPGKKDDGAVVAGGSGPGTSVSEATTAPEIISSTISTVSDTSPTTVPAPAVPEAAEPAPNNLAKISTDNQMPINEAEAKIGFMGGGLMHGIKSAVGSFVNAFKPSTYFSQATPEVLNAPDSKKNSVKVASDVDTNKTGTFKPHVDKHLVDMSDIDKQIADKPDIDKPDLDMALTDKPIADRPVEFAHANVAVSADTLVPPVKIDQSYHELEKIEKNLNCGNASKSAVENPVKLAEASDANHADKPLEGLGANVPWETFEEALKPANDKITETREKSYRPNYEPKKPATDRTDLDNNDSYGKSDLAADMSNESMKPSNIEASANPNTVDKNAPSSQSLPSNVNTAVSTPPPSNNKNNTAAANDDDDISFKESPKLKFYDSFIGKLKKQQEIKPSKNDQTCIQMGDDEIVDKSTAAAAMPMIESNIVAGDDENDTSKAVDESVIDENLSMQMDKNGHAESELAVDKSGEASKPSTHLYLKNPKRSTTTQRRTPSLALHSHRRSLSKSPTPPPLLDTVTEGKDAAATATADKFVELDNSDSPYTKTLEESLAANLAPNELQSVLGGSPYNQAAANNLASKNLLPGCPLTTEPAEQKYDIDTIPNNFGPVYDSDYFIVRDGDDKNVDIDAGRGERNDPNAHDNLSEAGDKTYGSTEPPNIEDKPVDDAHIPSKLHDQLSKLRSSNPSTKSTLQNNHSDVKDLLEAAKAIEAAENAAVAKAEEAAKAVAFAEAMKKLEDVESTFGNSSPHPSASIYRDNSDAKNLHEAEKSSALEDFQFTFGNSSHPHLSPEASSSDQQFCGVDRMKDICSDEAMKKAVVDEPKSNNDGDDGNGKNVLAADKSNGSMKPANFEVHQAPDFVDKMLADMDYGSTKPSNSEATKNPNIVDENVPSSLSLPSNVTTTTVSALPPSNNTATNDNDDDTSSSDQLPELKHLNSHLAKWKQEEIDDLKKNSSSKNIEAASNKNIKSIIDEMQGELNSIPTFSPSSSSCTSSSSSSDESLNVLAGSRNGSNDDANSINVLKKNPLVDY